MWLSGGTCGARRFLFDEIAQLKVWSNMGKKQLIIISKGAGYEIGWECISPRKTVPFAERPEDALHRHRFLAGRGPIVLVREDIKDKKKG